MAVALLARALLHLLLALQRSALIHVDALVQLDALVRLDALALLDALVLLDLDALVHLDALVLLDALADLPTGDRLELRLPDGACNPYLATAAVIAAGLDGIEHKLDPGEPHNVEEVIVRIRRGGRTALVGYRNRVTEVNVPDPDEMPVWDGR